MAKSLSELKARSKKVKSEGESFREGRLLSQQQQGQSKEKQKDQRKFKEWFAKPVSFRLAKYDSLVI